MKRSCGARASALLGLLAAVNFPTLHESPKPPAPAPISLYVWNASERAAQVTVLVEGQRCFDDLVAAGRGVSRQEVVELMPGRYAVEVMVGSHSWRETITVAEEGPRWLVVIWWGEELEITLQRQPPWLAHDGPSPL